MLVGKQRLYANPTSLTAWAQLPTLADAAHACDGWGFEQQQRAVGDNKEDRRFPPRKLLDQPRGLWGVGCGLVGTGDGWDEKRRG